jgi:acetate kinase
VIAILQRLIPLAPDHLPQALQTIQAVVNAYPNLPQVACFDTAFHRHMPRLAQIYPLPRRVGDEGIVTFDSPLPSLLRESLHERFHETQAGTLH